MNQDTRQLKLKPLEPGAPLDLAEARNAVMLARFAGADRYADDTYVKATRLLTDAEVAQARHRGGNDVMMAARQAVQTAEDARLISLQQQEEAAQADQRAAAQQRENAALDRARAEESARRQAEIDRLTAENARIAAERDKAAAEAAQRAAQAQVDQARALADQSARDRAAAEAARAAAEAQAQEARANAAKAEREKAELRDQLRQQLNQILETRETARGLIVNLSDVLFDTGSANLKPGAREKLAKVAGILLSHRGLKLQIEGHTDSVGSTEYNQRLSENRADSVRTYLVEQGIAANSVGTAGFGETMPVASNDTAAGRQQNRRVELIVSGESIGTAATATPTTR
jgi:outer membrane protein OmpA-like peptidoglycan-associated protein